jgi:integrase
MMDIPKAKNYVAKNRKSSLLVSKDGYSFDMWSNKWKLNKDISVSFQDELLSLEDKTLEGFRLTLARYAEELSASHTNNMYLRMQHLVRTTGCQKLDVSVLLNWKAALGKDREWYLGALKGFLISWFDYRNYGVTSDVVELLESLTLSGNEKGVAVANRCPYSGAFTENEVLAINDELNRLLRDDDISFNCYAYVSLTQATARRSVQIRQLKSCDLLKTNESGSYSYMLRIPRSKQRGSGFRSTFKKFSITEDLYLILTNLVSRQIAIAESIFRQKLSDSQKSLIPLFLDEDACNQLYFGNVQLVNELLISDFLHLGTVSLRQKLMKNFNVKQRAISERTGDIIHITSRRFRNTRGTNLGRKGFGVRIIAEALDHSDSQNAKVYTENTADTVQYIDKAVGKELAKYANAFLGRIIESLDDGERGDDPTARIPNDKNEVVGACGTNSFCVNGYESCYVCHKFRPLLEAPHEQFLENLYKEKEQRLKNTGSIQYASVKDRLILAVEQVVRMCDEIKVKKGGA